MDALEIKIFDSSKELEHFATDHILSIISLAVTQRNRCSIALSGGTSPKKIYELIAHGAERKDIDWGAVHVFWGDERCVPPDHDMSNYRMADEALLSVVEIPSDNIHRIMGELGAERGATEYEEELKRCFPSEHIPKMDLVLLGLGEDAHTASLFPFSDVLKEDLKLAAALEKEDGPGRITLTLPVINNAGTIIFIVAGEGKAEAISKVFFSSFQPEKYPAQAVKPVNGNLFWLVDKQAASLYLEKANKI